MVEFIYGVGRGSAKNLYTNQLIILNYGNDFQYLILNPFKGAKILRFLGIGTLTYFKWGIQNFWTKRDNDII